MDSVPRYLSVLDRFCSVDGELAPIDLARFITWVKILDITIEFGKSPKISNYPTLFWWHVFALARSKRALIPQVKKRL